MRTSKAAVAATLAGAVALASAAYGIGTQTGGGDAAARDETGPDGGPRFGVVANPLGGLAKELGVDADELRDALADFHQQEEGEPRDAFAAALAKALGKPVDEVRAALDEVRPGEEEGPGCGHHVSLRRLAAALDVTPGELRKALREMRAGADSAIERHRDDLVTFLADRFGISKDKVEQALPEAPDRPRFAPGGPHRFGPDGGPPRFGLEVGPG
jgi:hypothetical protein